MTDRPRHRADLVLRDSGDATAIYDPSTGTLFQLNATALAIWQACDGETTLDEITEALVLLTGRPTAELKPEVSAAITNLMEQGLLKQK